MDLGHILEYTLSEQDASQFKSEYNMSLKNSQIIFVCLKKSVKNTPLKIKSPKIELISQFKISRKMCAFYTNCPPLSVP